MSDLTILEPERKPGAQPGNTNAMKHGWYAKNLGLEGPKSIDESDMRNLLGETAMLKDFMFKLYTTGIEAPDSSQIAETLRALSLASMALSRLLDVHFRIKMTVPDNSIEAQNARIQNVITNYKLSLDELRTWKHD